MARAHAVPSEESFQIPAAAFTFEGFRRWAQSETFPETGRIDYLAGDVDVDMSPEEISTHSLVKSAFALTLGNLIAERELGYLFIDRTRVSSPAAQLSVEPDLVVLFQESLRNGRVRPLSWSARNPDRLTEIEGPVDLVVEVVSDSSVGKDMKHLPHLYAQAGVPELWIADARGEPLQFDVHTLNKDGVYTRVRLDVGGWIRSPRLGASFRLVRRRDPFLGWAYTLERRD